MASKILSARDAKDNEISITLAEQQRYEKPLRCESCDTEVSFVNGFFRNVGDDRVFVEPYFRLRPDHKHELDCPHNVEGQIEVIARKSNPDVLSAIKGNRFELRLLAVQQAIKQLRELKANGSSKPGGSLSDAKDKHYLEAEERLNSYINSAARVLKVRAVCIENKEIEDVLQLVFDGVRIPWNEFFFEYDNYFDCYFALKRASVKVPAAILGTIKSIKPVAGKNGPLQVINLVAPTRKTEKPDVLDSAIASIWSTESNAFDAYKPGQAIVAFGMWDFGEIKDSLNKKEGSKIRAFRNHELRLWPVAKAQLCPTKN